MQNVSETLAGRIAILKLQGLSLREILGVKFESTFFTDNRLFVSSGARIKITGEHLAAYP